MRLLALFLPLLLPAQPGRFGLPACRGPHLELAPRHGFFVCYDSSQQLPRWTAHQILPAPSTPHPRLRFRSDSQLAHPTLHPRDFAHSGFHRGHLTPAADLAADPAAYRDSFLLSNVIPQPPQVNNGIWRRLENAARRLALHADAVFVLTGTLASTSARRGRLRVPTHTFKVILAVSGGHKQMYAVLVPNHPDAASLTLAEIATTAREIEQATGLDLFHALDDPEEELLETTLSILGDPSRHAGEQTQPLPELFHLDSPPPPSASISVNQRPTRSQSIQENYPFPARHLQKPSAPPSPLTR